MFSKIVVGTDGSDTAAAAVSLAVELARQGGATLHFVSVFKDPATSVAVDPALTSAAAREACEELQARAVRLAEGLPVECHVVCGSPADMIVKVAEGVEADLIVVGSKGMRGARRIIGSVPNSVAHNAPCHVLIAKTT